MQRTRNPLCSLLHSVSAIRRHRSSSRRLFRRQRIACCVSIALFHCSFPLLVFHCLFSIASFPLLFSIACFPLLLFHCLFSIALFHCYFPLLVFHCLFSIASFPVHVFHCTSLFMCCGGVSSTLPRRTPLHEADLPIISLVRRVSSEIKPPSYDAYPARYSVS